MDIITFALRCPTVPPSQKVLRTRNVFVTIAHPEFHEKVNEFHKNTSWENFKLDKTSVLCPFLDQWLNTGCWRFANLVWKRFLLAKPPKSKWMQNYVFLDSCSFWGSKLWSLLLGETWSSKRMLSLLIHKICLDKWLYWIYIIYIYIESGISVGMQKMTTIGTLGKLQQFV